MNPRQRTLDHMTRLRGLALNAAAGALTSACYQYKVVDPMPESYPYEDTGLDDVCTADAVWTSTGNVVINLSCPSAIGEPSVTGAVLVSGTLEPTTSTSWSGEVTPDDGVTEVVLSFPIKDDPMGRSLVLHLDVSATPTAGASVPGSFEDLE